MAGRVKLQSGSSGVCLLLGCGYTARAFIPGLKQAGFTVFGTTRGGGKFAELTELGIQPLQYNGAISTDLRKVLANTTHLVCSIAPNVDGDPFIQSMFNHFGKNWRKALPLLDWAAYLSATSVYGDRKGHWVFEEELLRPTTRRGRARIRAELNWMESGLPVHIFRLAGIYGPGRNALKRIRSGGVKAVVKQGHVSNRIHVDDIATALMASIDNPHPLAIYNLADDCPAPPQDILQFGANLLGVPTVKQIPFEQAEMSQMARSFYLEARRTSNALAKQELGWVPKYPSYKEGLTAIFNSEGPQ